MRSANGQNAKYSLRADVFRFALELGHCSMQSVCLKRPSRPGEFHPEPLTDPDLTLSRHPARATARRLPPSVENWSSSCCQLARSQRRWPAPFAPRALPRFNTTTGQSAPLRRISTFGLAVGAACAFSLGIAGQVLTFRTRARLRFAPPPCRMPLGQSQDIPQANPGGMAIPRFWHRLIRFRHVISGSLALASLNHACRNLVSTFPQRSPPSLLTTAACGGLRSTPDCRPRRALLHLSYSCAPPCGPAILVTQCQKRTSSQIDGFRWRGDSMTRAAHR